MAQELRGLGVAVTERVGGTGVVGVVRNGQGPTVLIRADMDGLPLHERSGLAYASTARQVDIDGIEQPVMHACGHDTHMTALIGTARQLLARRDQWRGTLVLIAQPAEERIGGAKAMLEDGLYTRFPKPDYALALHVNSLIEAGKVRVFDTIAYSGSDSVNVKVRGIGAHGASPHRGIDPVLVASQIVVSLQSLVSRTLDPLEPGIVTVGAIHGGTKHNIIPEEVDLQLTVRADTPEARKQLLDGIRRIAEGTARAYGVPPSLLPAVQPLDGESTPPTANDPDTARRVRVAIETALGPDRMSDKLREGMGAEDFAYFVAPEHRVRGVYFTVGGTPAADLDTAASHHSPLFKITPEPAIRSGIEAMTIAALELLGKP
jgi:hippurate hydrolase